MTARSARAALLRPTGQSLLDELRVAANARGQSLTAFIAPLVSSSPENFIAQLGRAEYPTSLTVARVRACIAGEPVPPARVSPFKGKRGRQERARHGDPVVRADEIEARRQLTEAAHAARRPGETLEQALKRLADAADGAPSQPNRGAQ
jgi:hypothetical protein